MIIGGLVKNVEATSALGNAVAFTMMFLSGSFWMLDAMPKFIQDVAKVLPLTYFREAFRGR
jgi:ABC-2 type transport system permease protein